MELTNLIEPYLYDCIGVGFGPSNMALAIALKERSLLDGCLFLETQDDFSWHPGMLIEGADIQHNPLRDLVTPRNPCSSYGFLNYLKAHGRLFDYLNLAAPYPPRSEYAGYVKWVGEQFKGFVRLKTRVTSINFTQRLDRQIVLEIATNRNEIFHSKSLSFGTGRSILLPPVFEDLYGDDVVHLTDYLFAKKRWLARFERPRIAIIGGSQSAIEIVLDLSDCAQVVSISRSFGFKQKDLSAFTECIYYPSFVDYFFNSQVHNQNKMTSELWRSNYSAADPDVIEALNFKLYEQKIRGTNNITLFHNTNICLATKSESTSIYVLKLEEKYSGQISSVEVDGIVLATGYKIFGNRNNQEPAHPLLKNIVSDARFRDDGGIDITRDYQVRYDANKIVPPVFINGLCESSHGFGDAGSFSLLAIRSEHIAKSLERYLNYTNISLTSKTRSQKKCMN